MSLAYLLDTNVVSEALRPRPNDAVLQRLQEHPGEIAIAAIVWHELLFGWQRMPASARRAAVEAYLFEVVAATLPILPYDERAAEWHAAERSRLVNAGKTPPFADGQIAAIAAVNQLTLVTFNLEDFAHFEGLQVEDWR